MRALVCKRQHLVLAHQDGRVTYHQPSCHSSYTLAVPPPSEGDPCPVEIDRYQRAVRSDVAPGESRWRTRACYKGPCTSRLVEVPAVGAALLFCGPPSAHDAARAWRKEKKRRRSTR